MAVFKCKFYSDALGQDNDLSIFIPSDNSVKNNIKEMDVLLLLHGKFGNSNDWLELSRIEKYATERNMVVIMPNAYNSYYTDLTDGQNFFQHVANEVPNFVQKMFGISTEREKNYVAGLSMGGYGAFKVALTYPERYCYGISLSGALDIHDAMLRIEGYGEVELLNKLATSPNAVIDSDKDLIRLAKNIRINNLIAPKLYIDCGIQDFLYNINLDMCDKLKEKGLDIYYTERPGEHNWEYWDYGIEKALEYVYKHK